MCDVKTCNTCKTDKPTDAFSKREASVDGLSPKCRECASEYDRKRVRPDRAAYREAYAKTAKGIEALNRGKYAWNKRNPDKRKASQAVNNALRSGRMEKKPCKVCGSTERIHGHHDDYSKPLEVRWLCPKHHRAVHVAINERSRIENNG